MFHPNHCRSVINFRPYPEFRTSNRLNYKSIIAILNEFKSFIQKILVITLCGANYEPWLQHSYFVS